MMRRILCCTDVLPQETEANAGAKANETVRGTKRAPIELIQLPPPAKLSGGNYNFESWLARNGSGSIASSSRSNVRSPELDFIPDPTSVEYVSDPEDEIQEVVSTRNWRRISRSLSQDSSKGSQDPDDERRFSIPSVNRPSSTPRSKGQKGDEKPPPFDQAAYFQAVRSNNKRRLQAEVESENSSRSVSTRASNRFRELETVEENPSDHRDELPGGPRDRIETAMSTGISALRAPRQPTRPPAAKLSNQVLKVDPADITLGDRRRSSCPKIESGSKVVASQLIIRERASLPLMPPAPVLVAQQDNNNQDDESFKTWRLSQSIPQGDSQATLTFRPPNVSSTNHHSVVVVDAKSGTEPQDQPGTIDITGITGTREEARNHEQPEGAVVSQLVNAPVRPLTADSAQSHDGSGWETWLLAEKLTSQDHSVSVQEVSETNAEGASSIAGGGPTEMSDIKRDAVNMTTSPTSLSCSTNPGGSLTTLAVDRTDGSSVAFEDLPSKFRMKGDITSAVADSATETVLQYPSSSVYSSMQNTRPPSPMCSKDASGCGGDSNSFVESLIDLDLGQFERFNDLQEQRSNESYRTAPDLTSDPVIPSIVLLTEDAPCNEVTDTPGRYRYKSQLTTNLIGAKSNELPSLSASSDIQSGMKIVQHDTANSAPSRKSSFLQVLRNGIGSGLKGHGKLQSQPSELTQLDHSSASHKRPQSNGHAKTLSSLSTESRMQPPNVQSAEFTAPKLTESATVVWKRAIQVEHDQREAKLNAGSKKTIVSEHTTSDESHHVTNNEPLFWRDRSKFHSLEASAQLGQSATPQQTDQPHSIPRKPSTVIESAPRKLATPPKSWAKWASHNRHERTAAAGLANDVTAKDFAALYASKDTQQHVWITEKHPDATEAEPCQPHEPFPKKLGKAVKKKLAKAISSKSGTKSEAQLEFPELEVLPTKDGYKDLEAIQKSVATLKASERAKMATNPALAIAEFEFHSQQALIETLPAQLQEANHAGHDFAGKTTVNPADGVIEGELAHVHGVENPSTRPVTPANRIALPAGDSTAATTTENWVTPASRLTRSLGGDDNSTASVEDAQLMEMTSKDGATHESNTKISHRRPEVSSDAN
ncbi:hypothetical protein CTA2_12613 [Colletotrichum tanaceti]|uniref:Uncharacterized protein n=1 Tax=Colletotrichum tanaceti TaxID=1306861 RepID=A0A4U6XQ88_9PEZI|nr:hypothetical protein CTA2_12613 [Colletotrichum tanaceti]TKW58003.1 hypothetical protein CTA1_766 [Colletotrichum tanaceti]